MVNKTLNANKVKVAKFLRDKEHNEQDFYCIHIGEGINLITIFFTELSLEFGRTLYLRYNGILISILTIEDIKISFEM